MNPTGSKIVATLGPASSGADGIRRLIDAGADVFRLNFSHGDTASHAQSISDIRQAAESAGKPVAILQDLQGPRIRTGRLKGRQPVDLQAGAEVILCAGAAEGDGRFIAVNYEQFAADIMPSDRVLIADGQIELTVLKSSGTEARCRVITGGLLGEHKGINLPGARLSISAPTEKDLADLKFGMEHAVDYVALSFVEKPDDILRLREAMTGTGAGPIPIIPKIERPQAVDNLMEILSVSDGAMVARGDLGIEMQPEHLPAVQKRIIRAANELGIPVITATQMLDSMIRAPRPTRAEASDVANAVLDGTDAVMLSGETSIGRYPVESVKMMDRIARNIEAHSASAGGPARPEVHVPGHARQTALATAAADVARQLQARAIVAFTMTGSTARFISQRRPGIPIYALTPNPQTCRRLSLLWGVHPVQLDMFATTDEMIQQGGHRLLELGLVESGQTVVYVAGGATRTPGGTDMLKIHRFP